MRSKVTSPTFIPQELKVGGGWYVVATLSDGRTRHIGGFATEIEATEWIKNESVAWVTKHAGAKGGAQSRTPLHDLNLVPQSSLLGQALSQQSSRVPPGAPRA